MASFIPRKRIVQTRPTGVHELNQGELASYLDIYLPMTMDLRAHGKSSTGVSSSLVSSGTDTTYLQFSEDGIQNTVYDGTYTDGMALNTDMPGGWTNEFTVGLQFSSRNGNFSNFAFGLGDDLNADTSVNGSNRLYIDESNIRIYISNYNKTFTNCVIRDGNPHTYVGHVKNTATQHLLSLFVDGVKFGNTQTLTKRDTQTFDVFNLGCLSGHHNRGLNGVVHSAFISRGAVDLDAAKALSANPYQVLKPRKTYFALGATFSLPFKPSWAYKTNTLIGGL